MIGYIKNSKETTRKLLEQIDFSEITYVPKLVTFLYFYNSQWGSLNFKNDPI